jgi:hypothetical protein
MLETHRGVPIHRRLVGGSTHGFIRPGLGDAGDRLFGTVVLCRQYDVVLDCDARAPTRRAAFTQQRSRRVAFARSRPSLARAVVVFSRDAT